MAEVNPADQVSSQILAEYRPVHLSLSIDQCYRVVDVPPSEAQNYAQTFLELRQRTWSEKLGPDIAPLDLIEELYAPTAKNVDAQLRHMGTGRDPLTRYLAMESFSEERPYQRAVVGLARVDGIRGRLPLLFGMTPDDETTARQVHARLKAIDIATDHLQKGVGKLLLLSALSPYDRRSDDEQAKGLLPEIENDLGFMVDVPENDARLNRWLDGLGLAATKSRVPRGKIRRFGSVAATRTVLSQRIADRYGIIPKPTTLTK